MAGLVKAAIESPVSVNRHWASEAARFQVVRVVGFQGMCVVRLIFLMTVPEFLSLTMVSFAKSLKKAQLEFRSVG